MSRLNYLVREPISFVNRSRSWASLDTRQQTLFMSVSSPRFIPNEILGSKREDQFSDPFF